MTRRLPIAVVALFLAQIQAQGQTARSTFTETDLAWTLSGQGALVQQFSGGHPGGLLRFNDASEDPLQSPDEGWVVAPAYYLGDWTSLNGVASLSWDQIILVPGQGVVPLAGRASVSGPGGSAYWLSGVNVDLTWRTFTVPINSSAWVVTSGTWNALLASVTELRIRIEGALNTSGTQLDSSAIDNVVLAAPGSVIRVDGSAAGARTGTTWADAFRFLDDALAVAKATDEIWIADGTYTPAPAGGDRLLSFQLRSQLALYGGFGGDNSINYPGGETLRSQRDVAANVCVLSGDLNGNDGPGFTGMSDNSYHVLTASSLSNTCILDGFVIRGGNATSVDPLSRGGGIYLDASPINIANCRLEANLATFGGAIGGWLGSHATLTNCTLTGNRANYGGALYCDHSNPSLTKVSFIGNTADFSGGGVYNDQSSPAVVNCLFIGNIAIQNGGAIRDYNSSSSQLINCTVANNSAGTGGAGISLLLNSNLRLTNSILWNNRVGVTSNQGTQVAMSGNLVSPQVSYTCIQGWTGSLGGTGNLGTDPQFRDLDGTDNVLGTADDDLHLLPASTSIDAGSNAAVPVTVTTDLDGGPRFIDELNITDTGVGTAPIVDMGVYEAPATQALIVSTTTLSVSELDSAQFTVRMLLPPVSPLQVNVVRISGDPDLAVANGAVLDFDANNYATPQPVTIAAADDNDHLNSSAVFQISSPGMASRTLTATEIDTDPLPARLYVDRNAVGTQTGETWSDALPELTSALAIAALQPSVIEIWVAAGTYKPAAPGNRNASFGMISGLAIYGGFAGTLSQQYPGGETLLSQRDIVAFSATLSGDLSGNDGPNWTNISDNSNVVVSAVNTNNTAVLDGFVISGGFNTSTGLGAGLSCTTANPIIRNCTFRKNRTSNVGGAVCVNGGNVTISNCTFLGNFATSLGGGLGIVGNGSVALRDSLFAGNTGTDSGAVFMQQASCTMTNCVFTGNSANSYGSAIRVWSAATATLNNCSIAQNTLTTTTGGALYMASGTSVTLNNSILWGNVSGGNTDEISQFYLQAGSGSVRNISYTAIQGWTGSMGGTGNNGLDPLFMDVDGADNVIGTLDDDVRLQVRSPSIDSGSNTLVSAGTTTDVAGSPRFLDDPSATDTGVGTPPIVDRGAYESPPNQDFLLSNLTVQVPEGASAQFTIRLAIDPLGPVSVTVSVISGDADVSVLSGEVLSFDSQDWSIPHPFVLAAAEDPDWLNGQAVVRIQFSPSGLFRDIIATEQDNETVPTRVYVDRTAVGLGTGVSWTDAFSELRTALTVIASRPGASEIWVAGGTYRPASAGGSRNSTFQLSNGIAFYGGFAGLNSVQFPGGETLLAQRDWTTNLTILSGDLNANDGPNWTNINDNCNVVVSAVSTNNTAVLDGFVISGGYNTSTGLGAGLSCTTASPVIRNCVLRTNRSSNAGGAVCVIGGNVTILSCAFLGNFATSLGGGLAILTNGSVTLRNSLFSGNTGSDCGGIFLQQATATMTNCVFTGNSASGFGSAIRVLSTATVTLSNCSIAQNTLTTNTGGAFYIGNGTTVTLNNSILWGNVSGGSSDETAQFYVQPGNSVRVINYTTIQGWSGAMGGTGNNGLDPRFVDVDGTDNVIGTLDDDVRLRVRSSGIDSGSNTLVPIGTTTDAAGLPRFVDDPSANDTGVGTPPIVDRGAYEALEHQDYLVSEEPINVPEGGTKVVNVRLAMAPAGSVTIQAAMGPGDPDVTLVAGQSLTFDGTNWATPQPITLAAAQDVDWLKGQARLDLSSPDLPLVETRNVIVFEQDDEPLPSRLFVDRTATGIGTGTTWQDAFVELRDAMSAMATRPGVPEVWVALGTYKPGLMAGGRNQSFYLASNLAIYGGFAGLSSVAHPSGETDLSQRDIDQNIVVLSGDLVGNDGLNWTNRSDNTYHVVTALEINSSAVLDGFTIRGGMADQSTAQVGGGLYCQNASPTIRYCRFTANQAIGYGGGAGVFGTASPTFLYCTFIANSSLLHGGGFVHGATGTSTLTSCRFLGNTAVSRGGGGFFYGTDCKLTNCLFSGNTANSLGGAVSSYTSAKITLTNCTLSNNIASSAGGGIHDDSASVVINNSILWGNRTSEGANESTQLYLAPGHPVPTVRNCDVQGWSGLYGGVFNFGLDPRFTLFDGLDGLVGTDDDNCRFLDTSPCIDAGNSSFIPAGVTTDLDAKQRVVLDFVDLGAYEYTADGPISVIRANSRMVHGTGGTFDVDLLHPLPAQLRVVECRAGGPVKVIVDFSRAIFGAGGLDPSDVSLTSTGPSNGTVNSVSIADRQLTINMSGVSDNSQLKIAFPGIRDGANNPVADQICINVLAGDADGNSAVNVFDLVVIRNALNSALSLSNFRTDVISDGAINILELVRTRNNFNFELPQQCP